MKKVLVVSNAAHSGGVEISLINFIREIKKRTDINVKLLLVENRGVYKEDFEKIIDVKQIQFKNKAYDRCISFKKLSITEKIIRLFLKMVQKISTKAYMKCLLKNSLEYEEKVDLVIDYHGYGYFGTYYAAKKIHASNKILFLHAREVEWIDKLGDIAYNYDYLFAVSNSCAELVRQSSNYFKNKIMIFHNILDIENINKLAQEKINKTFDESYFNILTIGRLEWEKGYDYVIEIAKQLKNKIKFRWYIIGSGKLEEQLVREIKENNLDKNIIMLGFQRNPYPYLKKCDIYVQPSRNEGYGLAIAEARILKKPIIASKIDSISEHVINGKTGVLLNLNVEEFSNEILKMYNDDNYRNSFINYLEQNEDSQNDMNKIIKILEGEK